MDKFLIFDADKSLSTLGTPTDIERLSGFAEFPVTSGIEQVAQALGIDLGKGLDPHSPTLFVKKVDKIQHSLFPNIKVPTLRYEYGQLAKDQGITGIVIDTISHIFGQDLRILEGRNQGKQLQQQDWGTLERMYLTFFEALKHFPCWVVVNCHTTYDKSDTGAFYYYPLLKGKAKDRIREFFDVVLYTKTSADKKNYSWQSYADTARMAKDRINVLEPTMPQDFKHVLDKYRTKGYEPKILVIGESGTGKTKALSTINK